MITLGSVKWGTGPIIPITFAYEKQRSGADMQYRVQVTVATITGSSYFGYPIYLDWNVGGSTVDSVVLKKASPSRWTSEIIYTSEWYTVSNKVSGTTEVKFRVYSGSGGNRDNTYTYSMGVDPAASKVSASNGTLATALNLTVTRYNSGFTHTITYKCGSASGTVCTKATATTVVWNTTNGNVLALASQNTAGSTVSVTFTITTYSGTTVIGTDGTTVTMTIPDTVKPSVAVKVEDAAGYLATYGAYVQGWSKLKITATPTLAYNSPITAYTITADGRSYHSTPVTTGVVQGKGTIRVTAKVTDARTRPSEAATADITVLEYFKPSVKVTAYRCDSSGVENAEGAYMRVGFTATIASLNGKNSASYTINYGGTPITGTGTSYLSGAVACDVSQVKSVDVTVSDKLDTTKATSVIPIAFTLMDFHDSGEGVALGKVATRKGFDCAMPAYFTGGVHIDNQALSDYIVAQGVTNGWTWRKWNSGVAECWYNGDATVTYGQQINGFYFSYGSIRFPFAFTSDPVVTYSVCATDGYDFGGKTVIYQQKSFYFYLGSSVDLTSVTTTKLQAYAVGSWK